MNRTFNGAVTEEGRDWVLRSGDADPRQMVTIADANGLSSSQAAEGVLR